MTYTDCHNTGNFTLGEKSVVNTQTRWGGFVGKLEKNAGAGKEVYNIFDGCSNSGDIIIKGVASKTQYAAFGGIYGTATGDTQVIIKNGFVNSGDIIFEATTEAEFVDDTTLANRKFVELGGLFGHVASTISFSNADHPTWTGDVVNTGTIKFTGDVKSGVRLGGIAGYMQNSAPVITDGKLISVCDVICEGTFNTSLTDYNGIGGVAGGSAATIDGAVAYCSLQSPHTRVGMITGSLRSDVVRATNCAVGGSIVGAYDTEDEAYKTITLDGSNYYNYVFGGDATDWGDSTDYDGCTLLTASPLVK